MKIELSHLENDFQSEKLKGAVLTRLKEGDTTFSVAAWLQQDLLLYTEISPSQLSSLLKEFYIAHVPVEDRMGLSANRTATQRTAERMRRQTSALEEMEFLYNVQRGRIDLFHEEELQMRQDRLESRKDKKFENEIDDIFNQVEETDEGNIKGRKPAKPKKKERDAPEAIIIGLGANELETARRMLVDIHKMRTELKLNPRQSVVEMETHGPALTEDFAAKRARAVKDALRKLGERNVNPDMVVDVEAAHGN